jgi:hypothetical protein
VEDLADVAVGLRPDELVAPGLVDDLTHVYFFGAGAGAG